MASHPSTVRTEIIAFGVFCVDLRKGELRKFDRPIKLQPQPFRLLLLLLNRSGELVTREEIRQEIWGRDTYVDFERGLNHCVRQIRAALGDDASTSRYIETVPRSGYRFIAPVTRTALPASSQVHVMPSKNTLSAVTGEATETGTTGRWRARPLISALLVLLLAAATTALLIIQRRSRGVPSTPTPQRTMIAVLPFENLTGDTQQEYLSDGITDEMILQLSKLSPELLGVIARTSSMKYKDQKKGVDQISRELGVAYLLEGSVKRVGAKIRVTAELIQSRDQTHVWADSYDGEVSGEKILAFQQRVSDGVARSLSVMLPAARPHRSTSDPAAYDAYLKGRYYWNKRTEEGFQTAIRHFKEAITRDPDFPAPYSGMADSYNLMLDYFDEGATTQTAQLAKEAALKELGLDPDSAEAHASLGFNLWRYEWKFNEAELEFQKAINLDPNYANAHHWYGLFLMSRSRLAEARTELDRAEALDPVSSIITTNVGWVDYVARDYDRAIARYQESLALNSGFPSAYVKLTWAYEGKKMWREALESRKQFYRVTNHASVAEQIDRAFQAGGYNAAVRVLLDEAQKPDRRQYYGDYAVARLQAVLGDKTSTIAALQRASKNRNGWMVFLASDPVFDGIRDDSRFQDLVKAVEANNQ